MSNVSTCENPVKVIAPWRLCICNSLRLAAVNVGASIAFTNVTVSASVVSEPVS